MKIGNQQVAVEQVSRARLGELLSMVQAAPWPDGWLAVEIDPEDTPEYLEADIRSETEGRMKNWLGKVNEDDGLNRPPGWLIEDLLGSARRHDLTLVSAIYFASERPTHCVVKLDVEGIDDALAWLYVEHAPSWALTRLSKLIEPTARP